MTSKTIVPMGIQQMQRRNYKDSDGILRNMKKRVRMCRRAERGIALLLAHEGRFDEAIREYRLALDAQPSDGVAENTVRLNLALAYFKTAQTAKAVEQLTAIHSAEPANQQVTLLLATCYLRQGQNKKVASLLDPLWQPQAAHQDSDNSAIA